MTMLEKARAQLESQRALNLSNKNGMSKFVDRMRELGVPSMPYFRELWEVDRTRRLFGGTVATHTYSYTLAGHCWIVSPNYGGDMTFRNAVTDSFEYISLNKFYAHREGRSNQYGSVNITILLDDDIVRNAEVRYRTEFLLLGEESACWFGDDNSVAEAIQIAQKVQREG